MAEVYNAVELLEQQDDKRFLDTNHSYSLISTMDYDTEKTEEIDTNKNDPVIKDLTQLKHGVNNLNSIRNYLNYECAYLNYKLFNYI